MKQPRLDVRDALVQPTVRSLLAFLAKSEDPVRARTARETLQLSIGKLGLAMRSLERHGLAMRRTLAVNAEETPKQTHVFIEATDLGREHAREFQIQAAPTA